MTRRGPPENRRSKTVATSRPLDTPTAAKVFISYSHKDTTALARLQAHLSSLKRAGTEVWVDENILPGEEIDKAIPKALRQANIFVALVSSDYMASTYCFDTEYKYALGRRERHTMYVVAVIIRPCDWKQSSMARYKALPRDGKAVVEWPHQDKAYADIAEGIRRVVSEVRRGSLKSSGRMADARPAKKGRIPASKSTHSAPRRPKASAAKPLSKPLRPRSSKSAKTPKNLKGHGRTTSKSGKK